MSLAPDILTSMEHEDPVQLADLLQRLTKRLRRAQAERLAPFGLTPAQERALRMITRSEEPPRMTELADHLGIVPRSLTTVVDAPERPGSSAVRSTPTIGAPFACTSPNTARPFVTTCVRRGGARLKTSSRR